MSTTSDSDRSESEQSRVHESTTRLLPTCGNSHNHTKGKNKYNTAAIGAYAPHWSTNCAAHNAGDCTEGRLIGCMVSDSSVRRFPVETPMDELKAWLNDRHISPTGAIRERDQSVLSRPYITFDDLLSILFLAIDTVRMLHAETEALLEYAARPPYGLRFDDVAEDADYDLLDWQPKNFVAVPRWGLESDVFKAAEEVDYLRDAVGWIMDKIREARGEQDEEDREDGEDGKRDKELRERRKRCLGG